jgi:hypothetical protein
MNIRDFTEIKTKEPLMDLQNLWNKKAREFLPKGAEIISVTKGEKKKHIRNDVYMINIIYKYNNELCRTKVSGQLMGLEKTYKEFRS